MSSSKNFLDESQCLVLLPDRFSNIRKLKRQIYSSSLGNLYIRGSKDYGYPHKTWWYSIDPEIIKRENIAYLVLAADYKGIFVIPADVFFTYRLKNNVGSVKGGREDFSILRLNNRYIRHESKCDDEDLTRYFIPYTHISITNN